MVQAADITPGGGAESTPGGMIEVGSTVPCRVAITHSLIKTANEYLDNWDSLCQNKYVSQKYGW